MEEPKNFENMESLYEQSLKTLTPGDIVEGIVVGITDKEVLVDVGYKAEGTVPISEFEVPPEKGKKIEVFVRSISGESGVRLSKREAEIIKLAEKIKEAFKDGKYIRGKITKKVKGGYKVDLGGIEAFLPLSQSDEKIPEDTDALLGIESDFKILDVKGDGRNINVIVSRRAYILEEKEREKELFWQRLKEGKVLEGKVKKIMDYGVFIDLGPEDGLLHISDISWKRIEHPSEVLSEGQRVWVKVLSFDKENRKISLGMKQLTEDPWKDINKKYPVGSRVKGVITRVENYGAFVELEEGVEGLIHISEFSWTKRIKHPSEIVKPGDEVECVIIDIKPKERKLSLSLKRIEENPWSKVKERYPEGSIVKGKVTKVLANRVIVELEKGIEAFINAEDLSWSRRLKHPSEVVQKGDEVSIKILLVEPEKRRIRAGLKQVLPDPWDEFTSKYKEGDIVTGEVTSITNFGAFVRITEEIEGLIHISHLDEKKVKDPKDVINIGDKVTAKIINIDKPNRKVSLSIKEYKKMKEKEEIEKYLSSTKETGAFKLGDLLKKAIELKEKLR